MQGRFPKKSCEFLLGLLTTAESNAEAKRLEVDNLVVSHIQVISGPLRLEQTQTLSMAIRLNTACFIFDETQRL
jgi:hypothetical protein